MPACRVEIDVIRVREASILHSLKGEMPACKVETSDSYTPSNLGIQTLKGEMPACRVETEMSSCHIGNPKHFKGGNASLQG